MAGEFGQFKPAERRLSDVTAVQSPVQDTSSASDVGILTQGIAALGQAGLTAFQVSEQQKAKRIQEEQQQALMEQKKAFETELIRAKDVADQQGSSSLEFKTFLTQAFESSALDFDVKSKMMKDFQATVLGKAFTTISPEERAMNEIREQAVKAGFYTPESSEAEQESGLAEYMAAVRQEEADAAALRQINLQQKALDLTQDQRSELEREAEKKQFGALANLAANYRTPVKNKVMGIVQKLQEGVLSAKEAQDQLRLAKGDLEAVIAQTTRDVKNKASVEALAKPLLDLYDYTIEHADSASILKELKAQNQIMIETTKFNQLSNDPDLVELVSLSSLVGHNNPALFQAITPKTAEVLRKNSRGGMKVADVTDEATDTKTYLDLMSNAIDRVGVLKADNTPEIDQQDLLTNINNTLLGANRYIDPEDPPTQNKQILEWLAQPKVGEYVKDNLSQLTPAARVKLTDTLVNNAVNYVYPRLQELTSSLFVEKKTPRIGTSKVAKTSGGILETEVEMVEQGNAVVFKGVSPESQRVAETLNNEVAGALTTYFNATANVSGDSFSTVFEREKQVAWPSKYGEPVEDGEYVDSVTGEKFTIKDGKRVGEGDEQI